MTHRFSISVLAVAAIAVPLTLTAVKLTGQSSNISLDDAVIIDNQTNNEVGNFLYKGNSGAERLRKYFKYGYKGNRNYAFLDHSSIKGETTHSYEAEQDGKYAIGVSYIRDIHFLGTAKYSVRVDGKKVETYSVKQGQKKYDGMFEYQNVYWVTFGEVEAKKGEEISVYQQYDEDEYKWTVSDAVFFKNMTASSSSKMAQCSDGSDNDKDGLVDYSSIKVRPNTPAPWQNPMNKYDVNNDNWVTKGDREIVQNSINAGGARKLGETPDSDFMYIDVTGDGYISPSDVNALNTVLKKGAFATPDPDCDSKEDNSEEPESVCGNGIVEGGEKCDDSNTEDNDYCSSSCQYTIAQEAFNVCAPMTGDTSSVEAEDVTTCLSAYRAVLQSKEGDDNFDKRFDFNKSKGINIQDFAPLARMIILEGYEALVNCGDGEVQESEQCDDGNTDDNDYCSSMCEPTFAQNAFNTCASIHGESDKLTSIEAGDCVNTFRSAAQTGEDDDGYNKDYDFNKSGGINIQDFAALARVLILEEYEWLAQCGDGEVQEDNEECDDASYNNEDGCSNICTYEYCGDGVVQESKEECDDGNTTSGDGCSAWCQSE